MSEENKKTATERLEVLENTVNSIIQAIQPLANMAQDLMALSEAVKLLNNKLDAVVKSINAGTALTDENLGQLMTENNAKELQDKVTKMVTDGFWLLPIRSARIPLWLLAKPMKLVRLLILACNSFSQHFRMKKSRLN